MTPHRTSMEDTDRQSINITGQIASDVFLCKQDETEGTLNRIFAVFGLFLCIIRRI